MPGPTYSYRENGRSPLKLAFLAAGILMAVQGYRTDAPWIWWGIVLAFNVFTFWMVIANPTHGMDLDDERLTLVTPRGDRRYPLHGIERVEIDTRGDTSEAVLLMRDGSKVNMDPWAWSGAKRTKREFETRGVAVRVR